MDKKKKTKPNITFNNVYNIQDYRVNRPIFITINRLDNFDGIQEKARSMRKSKLFTLLFTAQKIALASVSWEEIALGPLEALAHRKAPL